MQKPLLWSGCSCSSVLLLKARPAILSIFPRRLKWKIIQDFTIATNWEGNKTWWKLRPTGLYVLPQKIKPGRKGFQTRTTVFHLHGTHQIDSFTCLFNFYKRAGTSYALLEKWYSWSWQWSPTHWWLWLVFLKQSTCLGLFQLEKKKSVSGKFSADDTVLLCASNSNPSWFRGITKIIFHWFSITESGSNRMNSSKNKWWTQDLGEEQPRWEHHAMTLGVRAPNI